MVGAPTSDVVDHAALAEAFDAFGRRGYAVALHITGDAEEAGDLVQEAFLRARRNLGSFRGQGSLQGWLLRIVVNLSLKHLRRRSVRQRLRHLVPWPRAQPSADWLVDCDQRLRRLAGALDQLPARQRTAFVLRHAHELSTAEVADAMGVAVPTVKTHLLRATERLRKQLEEEQ